MKCRRLESGVGDVPRNRRWSTVVETVLLLALAAGANPAQWGERQALKQPMPQSATAADVSRRPEVPASGGSHEEHPNSPYVLRLRALPGHYIDVVLMCEQNYAELTKSLVGSIGTVRNRLHCEQSLLAERLRTSGLTLPYTASNEDDGCAL